MNILVLTGTAGQFQRLVDAMGAYQRRHPESRVFIQWGNCDPSEHSRGAAFVPRAQVLERMAEADAVVCHAGSGTIRDALSQGHRPVLVPRLKSLGEHVDDHQLEIAEQLRDDGRAFYPAPDELEDAIEQAARSKGAPVPVGSQSAQLVEALTEAVEELGQRPSHLRPLPAPLRFFLSRVRPHRM